MDRDASFQRYEVAKHSYREAVASGSSNAQLAELASNVKTAAEDWEKASYEQFFAVRDHGRKDPEGAKGAEIRAVVAEAIHGLWVDLEAAHQGKAPVAGSF